ncbi:MAG: DUF4328 domain-containing protein, partial [Planctomycetes bacterium]|nr:DUF4328 domain-containing protein [Planctomycetota bacterium]
PYSSERVQDFVDKGQLKPEHRLTREADGVVVTVAEALLALTAAAGSAGLADAAPEAAVQEQVAKPRRRTGRTERAERTGETASHKKTRAKQDADNPYAAPEADEYDAATTKRKSQLSKSRYSFRPVMGISKTIMIMMSLYALSLIYGVSVGNSQIALLEGGEFTDQQLEASDEEVGMSAILTLIIIIPTMIVFMVWINKACKNAHFFNRKAMSITPGWAVGWYFVPFANLVKPCTAMKEMFIASGLKDKLAMVTVWWVAWLVFTIGNRVSGRQLDRAQDLESYVSAMSFCTVMELISILSTAIACILVWTLSKAQHELYEGKGVEEE